MPTRNAEQDAALIRAEFGHDTGGDKQARRFATWWGWRPSKARCCPMVAAGKRCLRDTSAYWRKDCICQRYHYPVLDHPRIWLDKDRRHVFTAEPYHFDGQEFAALVAECAELGLDVHVSGTSPYYPGGTCLIYIRRQAAHRAGSR